MGHKGHKRDQGGDRRAWKGWRGVDIDNPEDRSVAIETGNRIRHKRAKREKAAKGKPPNFQASPKSHAVARDQS